MECFLVGQVQAPIKFLCATWRAGRASVPASAMHKLLGRISCICHFIVASFDCLQQSTCACTWQLDAAGP